MLFLITGIIGHDPWKQDETYSFGIIYNFYITHSWLMPVNAGQPFMEKPPLYYWTATLLCKLFAGILPLHDAARLASTLYMLITCLSLWGASQLLFARYPQRHTMGLMALALLLGSIGLVRHAHDMFTDVALLAGTSVALFGMILVVCSHYRQVEGATITGIGIGMAFLSKGLLMPLILLPCCGMLVLLLPHLRTRHLLGLILLAVLAAFPFFFFWPYLLYRNSPVLFHEWFWENNIGRFLGFSVDRLGAGNAHGYLLYTAFWFAFPALPLACASVILRRHEWRTPELLVPLTVSVIGFVLLLSSASARALYLLPLLPGFALLAVPALMRIPEAALLWWNRAAHLLMTLVGIVIIAIWICVLHPQGAQPFKRLYGDWLPLGYLPQTGQGIAIAGLIVFSAIGLASWRLNKRSAHNTALLWLCGISVLWGLSNTLLLPWVDETRSFRPVIESLDAFVSKPPYDASCIGRYNLGESVAPMWHYFGNSRSLGPIVTDLNQSPCPLVLLQQGKHLPQLYDPRWHTVWKGSRVLDDKDELQLYERNK